jgi:chromosome partitioning protein
VDIFVFANQKGGVGKTTVTLGVAAALAGRGARVLLIDLDPQASATKALGIDVDEQRTVADVLLEPERHALADVVVGTAWRFDAVPAETALASRESAGRRRTSSSCVASSSRSPDTTSFWSTARRA